MENQPTNLVTLLESTEANIKKAKEALIIAADRVGVNGDRLHSIYNDVISEHKDLLIDDFVKALRNGGMGHYGRTYKFTTQEVSIWIRTYLEEKKKPKGAFQHLMPVN